MIHHFVTFPAFSTNFKSLLHEIVFMLGVYCDTLKKLCRANQRKRRGMLSRGVVMLHDNACQHTATATQYLIATFGWEQFDHPPYSPDLAPSDFHVFLHLKTLLGGRQFHDDNKVKEAINTWYALQVASFYDAAIQKLVPHYDKCLNNGGNYVEK
jgi:histone-lysine N-methyltransferase SETMAR